MKGVNLGGWLVTEHWMTKGSPAWHGVPDNIATKGEFKTMQYLGKYYFSIALYIYSYSSMMKVIKKVINNSNNIVIHLLLNKTFAILLLLN
jgi:hypothetical protein